MLVECPVCGSTNCNFYASHTSVSQELHRCVSCGFYFVFPHSPYIPSVTHGEEERETFRFWGSPEAEKAYACWRENVNDQTMSVIESQGTVGRVLEIGFGEGPLAEKLLQCSEEYWGIEPVPASLERTAQRLKLNRDRIFCLTAEELRESEFFRTMEGKIDMIVLISVFEHISLPKQVLSTCFKLLAPGGKLVINTPDSTFFQWLRRSRLLLGIEPWSYFHISFFNEKILHRLFSETGFEVVEKNKQMLITPESSEYFGLYCKSKFIEYAMKIVSFAKIDSLFKIQTLFYVLRKQ